MKNLHRWLSGAFISGGAIVVGIMVLVLVTLFTTAGQPPTNASAAKPTATATATPTGEKTDSVTGLPIVDGGNPAKPINGNASNADARTPVVRPGSVVTNWAGLDALLGTDTAYTACVSKTTGMNWSSDVPKFKSTESANDPRYILAVNTTASDAAIRKNASDAVGENLSGLKILRVGSIVNTRGFTSGGCQEFLDRRSMVRVSLGKFVYNTDGSVKGLQTGTGVFVDCHNPWRLPTPKPTPKSKSTPTPTPKSKSTPTPTPVKVCPPNQPHGTWPVCKDSPSNDPAARGNAPVGGGTNLNPGPGTLIPRSQMVNPPSGARVNPAPPVVQAPPVGSTPDPAPAPAPEPLAPVPADPATGTSCAPGIPVC